MCGGEGARGARLKADLFKVFHHNVGFVCKEYVELMCSASIYSRAFHSHLVGEYLQAFVVYVCM